MSLEYIKLLSTASIWLSKLPLNLFKGSHGNIEVSASRRRSAWNEEKQDILERANWLEDKILRTPEDVMSTAPSFVGSFYGGQWVLYSLSMYNVALANISYLYPEEKEHSLQRMQKAIAIAMSAEVKAFDADDWKEDPLDGLEGKKGHLTYYASLAWMICQYKHAGGNDRYDSIYKDLCEAICQRMQASKDMNIVSFRNHIVFLSDMVQAVLVLENYERFYNDTRYADIARRWQTMAKQELIHKPTGLLVAEKKYRWKPRVKGSYTALTNYYLCQCLDQDFAYDQYVRMKKTFMIKEPYVGIKEYQRQKQKAISFDLNAGPMLYGLSTSGTALALGTATYFGDWEFRYELLRTAEIGAQTVKSKGSRHYRMAEFAAVGEAFVLAMRTQINRYK